MISSSRATRLEAAFADFAGRRPRCVSASINLHPADNIPRLVADKPTAGSGDLCFITGTPIAEVVAHLNASDPDQNLAEISNY